MPCHNYNNSERSCVRFFGSCFLFFYLHVKWKNMHICYIGLVGVCIQFLRYLILRFSFSSSSILLGCSCCCCRREIHEKWRYILNDDDDAGFFASDDEEDVVVVVVWWLVAEEQSGISMLHKNVHTLNKNEKNMKALRMRRSELH